MNRPEYTPGFYKWLRRSKWRRTTKARVIKKHWDKYRSESFGNLLESHYNVHQTFFLRELERESAFLKILTKQDTLITGTPYAISIVYSAK